MTTLNLFKSWKVLKMLRIYSLVVFRCALRVFGKCCSKENYNPVNNIWILILNEGRLASWLVRFYFSNIFLNFRLFSKSKFSCFWFNTTFYKGSVIKLAFLELSQYRAAWDDRFWILTVTLSFYLGRYKGPSGLLANFRERLHLFKLFHNFEMICHVIH